MPKLAFVFTSEEMACFHRPEEISGRFWRLWLVFQFSHKKIFKTTATLFFPSQASSNIFRVVPTRSSLCTPWQIISRHVSLDVCWIPLPHRKPSRDSSCSFGFRSWAIPTPPGARSSIFSIFDFSWDLEAEIQYFALHLLLIAFFLLAMPQLPWGSLSTFTFGS